VERTGSNVMVKVVTDWRLTDYTAERSVVLARERRGAPYLVGRACVALEHHHQVLTKARGPSFIAVALWDIVEQGVRPAPPTRALVGGGRTRVKGYRRRPSAAGAKGWGHLLPEAVELGPGIAG
jgi:hypothetical protein